jgi:hypothetical protein
MVKSRHRVPLDELPQGAKPVGEVQWRDLPETEAEKERARFGMYGNQG